MSLPRTLLRLRTPLLARSRPTLLSIAPRPRFYAQEVKPDPAPSSPFASLAADAASADEPSAEVQDAIEQVNQSDGLRRLAEDDGAQDVMRKFSAVLESKGFSTERAPTIDEFAQLMASQEFRDALLEVRRVVKELELSEQEVGSLGRKMHEIQKSAAKGKP